MNDEEPIDTNAVFCLILLKPRDVLNYNWDLR